MRLGCLSLSFRPEFQARQLDDLRFIDLCAQLGLDGVDFNMGSFQSLERGHLKKIKKACVEHGLDITCIGVSNNFGRGSAEQEAVQQQILEPQLHVGEPLLITVQQACGGRGGHGTRSAAARDGRRDRTRRAPRTDDTASRYLRQRARSAGVTMRVRTRATG